MAGGGDFRKLLCDDGDGEQEYLEQRGKEEIEQSIERGKGEKENQTVQQQRRDCKDQDKGPCFASADHWIASFQLRCHD
jgi:hypothetical protein